MRPSSLIYILVGLVGFLIFASYQILNQPRFPNLPPGQSDVSSQSKSDPPSTYKDESRLRDGDAGPASLNTDESTPKDEAQLDGKLPATNQSSETAKDKNSQTATYSLLINPLTREPQRKTSHI